MPVTPGAVQTRNRPAAPLTYASLQFRVVAAILDSMVLISFFMVFFAIGGAYILLRYGDNPPGSAFLVWAGFILAFVPLVPLYFGLLWSWKGQSVGMMAVHIKVVRRDGRPLSLGRALARTLAWPLSLLPLGLGLVTIFLDGENRALHDYLAGTTVLALP